MTAKWSVGSRWQRWDPHLHAPGTLRNDQFRGDWDGYLKQIEEAHPAPVALGITDYFTLRGYKEVFRRRQAGALGSIPFVFANIELRLTIETARRKGINLHLLVSPDDPRHIPLMEEKLGRLLFPYGVDRYACTDEALVRLGRAHRRDPNLDAEAALAEGAGQFKVELSQVRELFDGDPWFRANVLAAVAAGADGLSGISEDSQFHAQREELGRFAHIVFSATPSDREYWLGNHPNFRRDGQTPKPCLHGCDAHSVADVLEPSASQQGASGRRMCWIRAEPTFDGLRQSLVEPGRRVHLGEEPPEGPSASDVIRVLRVRNAPWLETAEVHLNDGLVTIIGARGSGKTALADFVALAADADEEEPGDASFLVKAAPLLSGLAVEIEWGDGTTQGADFPHDTGFYREPRVRYLSQKFVENLCSSAGRVEGDENEPLNEEIEHVVFSAIAEEDRLGCANFAELRSVRLEDCLARERTERDAIREKTRLVAEKNLLRKSLDTLKGKTAEAERARKALEADLLKIPANANDAVVKAYAATSEKLTALKTALATEQRNQQSLRDLRGEVERQTRAAESAWQAMKTKYEPLLGPAEWEFMRLKLDDKAASALDRAERSMGQKIDHLRDHGSVEPTGSVPPPASASTPAGLKALEAEFERLTKALGLDQANAKRRIDLEQKLATAKQQEEKARTSQLQAAGAGAAADKLRAERNDCYRRVFEALDSERETLNALYEPLRTQLDADLAVSKLNFVVDRVVDVETWAARGERLLDLRREPFMGKGALVAQARAELLSPWNSGTPDQVRAAMETFAQAVARATPAQDVSFGDIGDWLFSTDHIAVRYAIRFEGLDLRQLSPGTRGVVLLTLYLGLDHWDRRPLVIDQPEENLDPRSVYEQLVPFFRAAANRRQIIMVTHNANLVVNTDSDQVIVAESTRTEPGQLPSFTYVAGGLEDPEIRNHVCRLLEGGEEAFERRRRRYAVTPKAS